MTTKSNAKLTKTENGWKMSDGVSAGEAGSVEGAYEAYKAAAAETEAFYGNSVRDAASELLEALEQLYNVCKTYMTEDRASMLDAAAAIAKAKGAA